MASVLDNIANGVGDFLQMVSGRASPQQLKLQHAQEGQQMDEIAAFNKFKASPEGQKYLGTSGSTSALPVIQQALANEGLIQQNEGLRTGNEAMKKSLEQTGGVTPETYRLFHIEQPTSTAQTGLMGAQTQKVQQDVNQENRATKELGVTPQTHEAQTRRFAVAGPGAEHIGMLQAMFPDPRQRRFLLSTLKTAGYDTSDFENAFMAEDAAKQKNLSDILALDKQNQAGQGAGAKGPSNFKMLMEHIKKGVTGRSEMLSGMEFEQKLRDAERQKQLDAYLSEQGAGLNYGIPGEGVMGMPSREDPIELLRRLSQGLPSQQ